MTQPSTVLSIFAMFLHTTFGESGCTSADGDGTLGDDEPDNFDIDCFSQLEIKDSFSSLTCNFTELPPYNTNYTLSLCTKEDNNYACSNMKKQEDAFFLQFNDILSNRDVCMYSETKRRVCRSLVVTDIVKPEVPFAINITYEREANEYLIRYCTPHSRKKYLKDKLVHQVAYRQKEGTWKTIESPYLQIKLLGRNLESEASYEVKVRSQPDGDYFKGTWSEWSTSKSFKTKREHDSMESYSTVAMIIFSILGFILSIVMIALIIIFWENRIKPAVWPNLPDHKKTLEQLCRKPKNPPCTGNSLLVPSSKISNFSITQVTLKKLRDTTVLQETSLPDPLGPDFLPFITACPRPPQFKNILVSFYCFLCQTDPYLTLQEGYAQEPQ